MNTNAKPNHSNGRGKQKPRPVRVSTGLKKEWLEASKEYRRLENGTWIPAGFMLVVVDRESREDYPVYAEKQRDVKRLQIELEGKQQTVRGVVECLDQ